MKLRTNCSSLAVASNLLIFLSSGTILSLTNCLLSAIPLTVSLLTTETLTIPSSDTEGVNFTIPF